MTDYIRVIGNCLVQSCDGLDERTIVLVTKFGMPKGSISIAAATCIADSGVRKSRCGLALE
jgi:hypothetical protein